MSKYVTPNQLESAQAYFDRWPEYYKELQRVVEYPREQEDIDEDRRHEKDEE